MSNYRNSNDLKKEILKKSGELQDGTSSYDADALIYLNNIHRSVLSGGNEFEVDLSEPWAWAIGKRPVVFTLMPPINTGSVTVTMADTSVTFSNAPEDYFGNTISVKGWHLKLDNMDEYYVIQAHNAGELIASIDVPFTTASVTTTFNLYKFDYDVIDDSIVVDSTNNKIDFQESSGALVASLVSNLYTPSAFATHVAAQMTAAGTKTYSGSWDPVQRLFTISASSQFSFLNGSGANAVTSASELLGQDVIDLTGASSYTSTYPLNAVNRIVGPMQIYRRRNTQFLAAEDEGKIYEIDLNTFIRKYPLTQVNRAMPEQFAITQRAKNGITTVRMASYVDQPTKVEAFIIPMSRDLQDNTASIPLLPNMFLEALVFGGAYYICLDKSDTRSEAYAVLCKAKLLALVHHNRKELSLAGKYYGKLIPRRGGVQRKYITEVT